MHRQDVIGMLQDDQVAMNKTYKDTSAPVLPDIMSLG